MIQIITDFPNYRVSIGGCLYDKNCQGILVPADSDLSRKLDYPEQEIIWQKLDRALKPLRIKSLHDESFRRDLGEIVLDKANSFRPLLTKDAQKIVEQIQEQGLKQQGLDLIKLPFCYRSYSRLCFVTDLPLCEATEIFDYVVRKPLQIRGLTSLEIRSKTHHTGINYHQAHASVKDFSGEITQVMIRSQDAGSFAA